MSPELITTLRKMGEVRQEFDRGELLFEAGEAPDHVYLIEEGRISFSAGDVTEDRDHPADYKADAPLLLGVKELFLSKDFSTTCRVDEKVSCWLIPRVEFLEHIQANPVFKLDLMRVIAKQLYNTKYFFE